jgi:hypothetical protein
LRARGERHGEESARNAANKSSPIYHSQSPSTRGSPRIVRLWRELSDANERLLMARLPQFKQFD